MSTAHAVTFEQVATLQRYIRGVGVAMVLSTRRERVVASPAGIRLPGGAWTYHLTKT